MPICVIYRFDGELLSLAAAYGLTPEFTKWIKAYPAPPAGKARRPARHSNASRSDSRCQSADVEYPLGLMAVGRRLWHAFVGVPILRRYDRRVDCMLSPLEVGPLTERQIELLETFADQAAIAIENVRLFEAEQRRTEELSESLEQQTATGGDSAASFQVRRANIGAGFSFPWLECAARLCDAKIRLDVLAGRRGAQLVVALRADQYVFDTWPIRCGRVLTGLCVTHVLRTKQAEVPDLADRG